MIKRICTVLACACPIFLLGSAANVDPACAHSVGACADHIVNACNNQWPDNHAALIACVDSGLTACETHSHGGGGGIEPGPQDLGIEDNDFSEEEPGSFTQPEQPQRATPERRVAPNR